jgi:hypothetical protein
MPTHSGHFCVIIVWDSIHSHHKFQHSPAYNSFMATAAPLIAGDIQIAHLEITDKKSLKKALESPWTQISHLFIKKGLASDNSSFEKYVVREKVNGMWPRHPYEDLYKPGLCQTHLTLVCFRFTPFSGANPKRITTTQWTKMDLKASGLLSKIAWIKKYPIELRNVYGDL